MKLIRKISVLLAVVCLALSATAAAATTYDLGEMNVRNNDTQKGWATDGVADTPKGIPVEKFATAEALVLEFSEAPSGGMQIIWQGDGSWDWNQTDGIIPNDGMTEKKLTIKLADKLKNYEAFKSSTEEIKIFLAYYSDTIADLKITKAYLTYAGETTINNENPDTGDGHILAIVAVTGLSAGAAVLLLRKRKTGEA